jgi:hypothetical protein
MGINKPTPATVTTNNTTQCLSENPVHKRKKEYIDLCCGPSEHATGIYNYFPMRSTLKAFTMSMICTWINRKEEALTQLEKEAKIQEQNRLCRHAQ